MSVPRDEVERIYKEILLEREEILEQEQFNNEVTLIKDRCSSAQRERHAHSDGARRMCWLGTWMIIANTAGAILIVGAMCKDHQTLMNIQACIVVLAFSSITMLWYQMSSLRRDDSALSSLAVQNRTDAIEEMYQAREESMKKRLKKAVEK